MNRLPIVLIKLIISMCTVSSYRNLLFVCKKFKRAIYENFGKDKFISKNANILSFYIYIPNCAKNMTIFELINWKKITTSFTVDNITYLYEGHNGVGTKNGNIVEYQIINSYIIYYLTYDGMWCNNYYGGYGISYYNGGLYRKGYFSNGLLNGYGMKFNRSSHKLEYEGELNSGNMHGMGICIHNGAKYEGRFKNDEPTGNMTITYEDGTYFKGKVRAFYRYKGIHYHKNGNIKYSGKYSRDKRKDLGVEFDESGKLIYDGMWDKDQMHGEGKLYINGKLYYKGSFIKNKFDGIGEYYYSSGQLAIKGYKNDNDKLDGYGELYAEDGKIVKMGNFVDGMLCGYGYIKLDNGDILNGIFENDNLITPINVINKKRKLDN